MLKCFLKNEKLNYKIKWSNNSSFVILIFAILKFRNIDRSTFRRSKFWPPPREPFFQRTIFQGSFIHGDLFSQAFFSGTIFPMNFLSEDFFSRGRFFRPPFFTDFFLVFTVNTSFIHEVASLYSIKSHNYNILLLLLFLTLASTNISTDSWTKKNETLNKRHELRAIRLDNVQKCLPYRWESSANCIHDNEGKMIAIRHCPSTLWSHTFYFNFSHFSTYRGIQYSHCPPKREPRINRVL